MRLYISTKTDDYRFVQSIIERRKLEPRIMGLPERQTSHKGSFCKIVESYPWGRVVFSHSPIASRTMVLVNGEGDHMANEPPPCLGMFVEKNHPDALQCYGDPNAPQGTYEAQPCSWQDACRKVHATANERGINVEELLSQHKLEEILGEAPPKDVAANAASVEADSQPTAAQPSEDNPGPDGAQNTEDDMSRKNKKTTEPKPKKAKEAKPEGAEGKANGQRRTAADMIPQAQEFFKGVAKMFGKTLKATKEEASTGDFYVRDKMEKSGYATLYAKSEESWDMPLCCVRPMPRDGVFYMELPATPKELSETKGVISLAGQFDINPFKDGKFHCIVKGVNEEKLPKMMELIAAIFNKGIAELPTASA